MRHAVVRGSPYTPDQLFALVADVERYPEFVPWITSLRTWNVRPIELNVSAFDAEATVGFSFLKERFSTQVWCDPDRSEITVKLIRGPFKHLLNRWRFTRQEAETKIEFEIDFEFKSRMLEVLLAANFDRAVDRLMRCFDERAAALYGGR